MESEVKVKSRTRLVRVLRGLLVVGVSLIMLAVLAHLTWKYSGSNRWELFLDRRGVQVYSLKAPGAELVQVKGVVRVRSTLSAIMALMQDNEMCANIGCHGAMSIERVDAQLEYAAFRYRPPRPFRTREFVIRQHVFQHPKTKQVFLEYAAAPEKLPPDDCCFRVTQMKNTWVFTPLDDGMIEIVYEVNMSEGGFLPYPILNRVRPRAVYFVLTRMQRWLDNDKYRNAKYAFIEEDSGPPRLLE